MDSKTFTKLFIIIYAAIFISFVVNMPEPIPTPSNPNAGEDGYGLLFVHAAFLSLLITFFAAGFIKAIVDGFQGKPKKDR